MSLSRNSEMRRCGRRFATKDAAASSKRARNGVAVPVECPLRCGYWHLEAAKAEARAQPFPPAVADQINQRDERCQRCGSRRGLHRHHRRGKANGGSRRKHAQCACNGILLCWLCHHWAHVTGRRQAEAEGFVVSQSVRKPGSVGVMRYAGAGMGGATQWPTCDGEWVSTAPEALEAAA